MLLRRWYLILLALSVAWSGYNLYRWHEISSGIERMSSRSDVASIVRIDKRRESSSSGRKGRRKTTTYYRPVIEFEDSDHISHTAPSLHESSNGSLHLKGDEVSVLYDPRDADSGCVIVGEEESTRAEANGKLMSAVGILVAGVVFSSIAVLSGRAYDKAHEKAMGSSGTAGETPIPEETEK